MSAARNLLGQGNGVGLAVGPVHIGPDPFAASLSPRDGDTKFLEEAIEKAIGDLQALMAVADERSRNILEFQAEMLSDPSIRDIGLERQAAGAAATLAWVAAIEDYIAAFQSSDDEDIRARAVDIIDMRNRVLDVMNGTKANDFPKGTIFVGADIAPSLFLSHDWTDGGGIALTAGSPASHVAMLARARAVPMVVGLGSVAAANGMRLLVDGRQGLVVIEPTDADVAAATPAVAPVVAITPLSPSSTGESIAGDVTWLVNISHPAELADVDPHCAGIGLLRSEFLSASVADLANEERQYRLYCEALAWAGARPVTVRLLDLGGDKTLGGFGEAERNPFLGMRGIRLLLAHPDLLRVQARALLRAAVLGNLKVMLPMVTVSSEIAETRRIFAEEGERLARRRVATRMPDLGMMVEVPAAALMLDTFVDADFFSLGTNDLAQYLSAAARDSVAVLGLHELTRPALMRLIRQAVAMARRMDKPIGICGDLAGMPGALPDLLACGLTQFSVAPAQLEALKTALHLAKTGS